MSFDRNKIRELYPGAEELMIEPMLIHSSTEDKLKQVCSSGDYFGQIKIDGSFYFFVKGSEGQKYLFGRTVSKKTGLLTEKGANVPHILLAFDSLPNNTILIGEIYYDRGESKDVTKIMGCLPKKAMERQLGDYGPIKYYIHDILMYDGVSLLKETNLLRYKILAAIAKKHEFGMFLYLRLAEVYYDDLYNKVKDALDSGEEGMVLKKKDGYYEPGKRPMTNFKAKKVDFVDVVIMGFEPPTKEYYGKELDSWEYNITEDGIRLCGRYRELTEKGKDVIPVTKPWYNQWYNSRIQVGVYDENDELIPIGIIHSGISDEMKEDMTKHPNDYFMYCCSIQMMEFNSKDRTIRHGFFKGMRRDKDPSDCLLKNI